MNNFSEKGDARSMLAAALVKTAALTERAAMSGVYFAQGIGPAPMARVGFAQLRDELFEEMGTDRAMEYVRRHAPGRGPLRDVDIPGVSRHQWNLIKEMHEVYFLKQWDDSIINVVTTVGANEILDKYFAGSGYTAAIVIGLKGTGAAVIADTQASHASWLEQGLANAPVYTGNRPTPSWSVAAAKTKAFSAAVNFAFTSGGTVFGAFLNQGGSATKDNTTGVLVSAGDFTGGSKVVANTDQINVSWSISV